MRGSPEFYDILERVEEYIDAFKEEYDKVFIVETNDSAFGEEFSGIVDFFNEVFDMRDDAEIKNITPKYITERFISIADKLWGAGIHPSEI